MVEFFRFFRLGIVNLVGITFPGFLTLFFIGVGLLLPLFTISLHASELFLGSSQAATGTAAALLYRENKGIIISLVIILSYIIGYILRLSTPDVLDRISADKVVRKMDEEMNVSVGEAAAADRWPYRGEAGNKFPYFHFREYLLSRGHPELANLVTWGPPTCEGSQELGKRTKTLVNLMKLEITTSSPALSAVVESNEAHVRLLSGTWQATIICRWLVGAGVVLSLLGLVGSFSLELVRPPLNYPYPVLTLIGLSMLGGMIWAQVKIENLFHYQRVRELTHILGCAYQVRRTRETGLPAGGATPG